MIKKVLITLLLLVTLLQTWAEKSDTTIVFTFNMKENVAPALWRTTQNALIDAKKQNADLVLIHMNTYGGMVVSADSIRTALLNYDIPVYVFIDNNAASAGALISIACDKIFMRPGANIGAATVVNQTGEQMPDKYQSFMRGMMRATAESHGKDTIIEGTDTTYRWKRDPIIAEAMVDADVYIENIIDTGKVITFTSKEAIKYGFCEGEANSIQQILDLENIKPAIIKEYKPSGLDNLISLMMNPIFQSLLIMIIFGGLYFELQSPGVGFPLFAAITAAILYFAPLYLEGIAEHWEIALFAAGIILIAVELFAIPGFGVAGVSGITLAITGLTLAMVKNFDLSMDDPGEIANAVFRSLIFVVGSILISFIGSIYLSKKLFASASFGASISLKTTEDIEDGYIGVDNSLKNLVGKTGIADTVLRPSGNILIDGELYDAKSIHGFIEKGTSIKVLKYEASQLYVTKC